jgi:hypothetical protein
MLGLTRLFCLSSGLVRPPFAFSRGQQVARTDETCRWDWGGCHCFLCRSRHCPLAASSHICQSKQAQRQTRHGWELQSKEREHQVLDDCIGRACPVLDRFVMPFWWPVSPSRSLPVVMYRARSKACRSLPGGLVTSERAIPIRRPSLG